MTELKTLEDLRLERVDTRINDILKSEAVKWVKLNYLAIDKPKEDCPTVTWNYSIAFMNNWIKNFFNLTEEDLK